MRQKGFIQIILILVVLAALAGIYYFGMKNKSVPTPVVSAQPSSSPMTNWKTYSTSNYEIKYPANLAVSGNNEKNNTGLMIICSQQPDSSQDCPIQIIAYKNVNNLSLSDWIKNGWGYTGTVKTIMLNNYEVQELVPPDTKTSWYAIERDGFVYNISVDKTQLANQILSTFKFTN